MISAAGGRFEEPPRVSSGGASADAGFWRARALLGAKLDRVGADTASGEAGVHSAAKAWRRRWPRAGASGRAYSTRRSGSFGRGGRASGRSRGGRQRGRLGALGGAAGARPGGQPPARQKALIAQSARQNSAMAAQSDSAARSRSWLRCRRGSSARGRPRRPRSDVREQLDLLAAELGTGPQPRFGGQPVGPGEAAGGDRDAPGEHRLKRADRRQSSSISAASRSANSAPSSSGSTTCFCARRPCLERIPVRSACLSGAYGPRDFSAVPTTRFGPRIAHGNAGARRGATARTWAGGPSWRGSGVEGDLAEAGLDGGR